MSATQRILEMRTWLRPGLTSVVLGALLAFVVGSQLERFYRSEIRMYVGPTLGGPVDNADLLVGQAIRQTLADLATTRPVLERVIAATGSDLAPEDLAGRVDARVPGNSNILELGVVDPDPAAAAVLANQLAAAVALIVAPPTTPDGTSNIRLTVVEPAIPASTPEGPGLILMVAMGALIGLIFAIALAFVVETLTRDEAKLRRPIGAGRAQAEPVFDDLPAQGARQRRTSLPSSGGFRERNLP